MNFKKIILEILIFITVSLNVVFGYEITDSKLLSKYINDLEKLSTAQYDIMIKSYEIGLANGMDYILPAIAWKESNFGDYMLNLSDGQYGSFGPYHIRLDYSIKRNNITGKWERDRHAEKLISDTSYSALEAVELINYWIKHLKIENNKDKLIRELFSAYNAGYKYNDKLAVKYGNDALIRVSALKIYFLKHKINERVFAKKNKNVVVIR